MKKTNNRYNWVEIQSFYDEGNSLRETIKKFGVSDNAIAKRCKLFDIEKPPRGYWAKLLLTKN